ncbi:glutathione S-transferase family protein [Novosphingobium sediminicola]|uniref:GST-like protein n=1 Tax=Novosphingobium sediminicola TaxID=563162 RepID=A0A7W6CNS5_9SPHN|nr:glutathione S-transferase family protein [Novosphingobium sediminicola]MBB3954877.1 GST-like protein [Novosphingobium sediminicola]
MLVLYHGEPNGPSLSVLAMLAECGLEGQIETRPINLLAGERHTIPGIAEPLARDIGVEGEGPLLVVDGEACQESVFLAQYLDEVAGAGLQPKDAYTHWQMMMWCRRITERCAPAAAFLGNQAYAAPVLAAMDDAAFDAIIAPIASADLHQRWADTRSGAFPDAARTDSRAKIADAAALVETQLADGREWLIGPLTIADFETYGWLVGMVDLMPDTFAEKSLTRAWMARMAARPSVQSALARAGVTHPERVWAPGPEINRWG